MAIRGTGFGEAGFNIVTSLQANGYKVPFRDPGAPVELAFGHPDSWEWSSEKSYKVGYMAWESTLPRDNWIDCFKQVDELWVTSPRLAEWMRPWTTKPIYVYEHGVDGNIWYAEKRRPQDVLRYLHMDGAAVRKGAGIALEAFNQVFKDSNEVSLTFKSIHRPLLPNTLPSNVKVIKQMVNENELAYMYRKHHVFVNSTWGEGFGIPGLQGVFTGMPQICTSGWAPYEDHLIDDLLVKTTLRDSPWEDTHPGKMYEPDFDDLVKKFELSRVHYKRYASLAFAKSVAAQRKYNWQELTRKQFQQLFDRI